MPHPRTKVRGLAQSSCFTASLRDPPSLRESRKRRHPEARGQPLGRFGGGPVQPRSRPLSFSGNLITTLIDLLSVYTIWQAFRNYNGEDPKRAAV